jgi:hypothetical protein
MKAPNERAGEHSRVDDDAVEGLGIISFSDDSRCTNSSGLCLLVPWGGEAEAWTG